MIFAEEHEKTRFCFCSLAPSACRPAELKKLTFEQAYLNKGEALLRPLPEIAGWLDDSRFIESRDGKIFLVDARSGRSRVLFDPAALKDKAAGRAWIGLAPPTEHSADYSRTWFSSMRTTCTCALNKKPGTLRRLDRAPGGQKNPLLSPGRPRLAYTPTATSSSATSPAAFPRS